MRIPVGILALLTSLATGLQAQSPDCSVHNPSFPPHGVNASHICVIPHGFDAAGAQMLADGADLWNSACDTGVKTPSICIGPFVPGCLTIDAFYVPGNSDQAQGNCAYYQAAGDGSGFMVFFEKNGNGTPCSDLYTPTYLPGHEMGHMLGLAEAYDAACAGRIMAKDSGTSAVNPDDCSVVDSNFETSYETNQNNCNANCWTDCGPNANCPPMGGGINECQPVCTPLVLDMAGDGIKTSGVEDPIHFDIDANGTIDTIGWIARGADDAFLWRDLEKNHRVDDGSELFGIGMQLPDGRRAIHGFEALAAYDNIEYGGNGDGAITKRDAVWRRLRLWVDANHNGISEKDELSNIQSSSITSLSLNWEPSPEVDAAGNEIRLRSTYEYKVQGRPRSEQRALVDVFFRRFP